MGQNVPPAQVGQVGQVVQIGIAHGIRKWALTQRETNHGT